VHLTPHRLHRRHSLAGNDDGDAPPGVRNEGLPPARMRSAPGRTGGSGRGESDRSLIGGITSSSSVWNRLDGNWRSRWKGFCLLRIVEGVERGGVYNANRAQMAGRQSSNDPENMEKDVLNLWRGFKTEKILPVTNGSVRRC
jgi:hypothetical protein